MIPPRFYGLVAIHEKLKLILALIVEGFNDIIGLKHLIRIMKVVKGDAFPLDDKKPIDIHGEVA